MENYKIKVNNEAESREAQKLFFQLGYEWYGCGAAYNPIDGFKFITAYADEMRLAMGWGEDADKELTTPQLRDLVAAHRKPTEQGLISGADALRAIADGKEVEHKANSHMPWGDASLIAAKLFSNTSYQFRLKPRTIKLSLEIPAPFESKEGEKAYRLAPAIPCGYTEFYFEEDEYEHQFGTWRTEEEIKQVVAALREAIKLA